jgi:transposase InsO family protein
VKRYRFIEAEKVAVRRACGLLGVSSTAYYKWHQHNLSKHELKDTELAASISKVHSASRGSYGSPRVHHQLRQDGVRCGRKRVARLMATNRLVGRYKRQFKKTTIADPEATLKMEDLVKRQFQPTLFDLNQVWVGDITYIRTHQGWCYLATVIDLASRRVVGFAMADHMRASLVCEALKKATTTRRPKPGLIFHSDRGSQYTSAEFRRLLAKTGILQSFSRPRQCWDNAVAESFFSTLKTELIYEDSWPTRAQVQLFVFEFIEVFYNRRRSHSSIGYCSPVAYEERLLASNPVAPAA